LDCTSPCAQYKRFLIRCLFFRLFIFRGNIFLFCRIYYCYLKLKLPCLHVKCNRIYMKKKKYFQLKATIFYFLIFNKIQNIFWFYTYLYMSHLFKFLLLNTMIYFILSIVEFSFILIIKIIISLYYTLFYYTLLYIYILFYILLYFILSHDLYYFIIYYIIFISFWFL